MADRTDLAMEAYALWKQDAQDTTQLPGVKAREEDAGGVHITRVDILDERGQAALGKPVGRYGRLELRGRAGEEEGGAGNRTRGVGVSAQPRKRGLRGARQRRDYAGRLRSLGAGEHSCDAAYEAAPAGGVFRLLQRVGGQAGRSGNERHGGARAGARCSGIFRAGGNSRA